MDIDKMSDAEIYQELNHRAELRNKAEQERQARIRSMLLMLLDSEFADCLVGEARRSLHGYPCITKPELRAKLLDGQLIVDVNFYRTG
jgi:hypothetical protein